jgi:hypothetical protein
LKYERAADEAVLNEIGTVTYIKDLAEKAVKKYHVLERVFMYRYDKVSC